MCAESAAATHHFFRRALSCTRDSSASRSRRDTAASTSAAAAPVPRGSVSRNSSTRAAMAAAGRSSASDSALASGRRGGAGCAARCGAASGSSNASHAGLRVASGRGGQGVRFEHGADAASNPIPGRGAPRANAPDSWWRRVVGGEQRAPRRAPAAEVGGSALRFTGGFHVNSSRCFTGPLWTRSLARSGRQPLKPTWARVHDAEPCRDP